MRERRAFSQCPSNALANGSISRKIKGAVSSRAISHFLCDREATYSAAMCESEIARNPAANMTKLLSIFLIDFK